LFDKENVQLYGVDRYQNVHPAQICAMYPPYSETD